MFVLLTLFACATVLLYRYLTYHFDCWSKQNIKGPSPTVLFGNAKDIFLFRRCLGKLAVDVYTDYPKEKCIGLFYGRTPLFVPRDNELVKQILIKDFNYFPNRGMEVSNDELGDNLFNSDEKVWRLLRQRLTPVFSSGKLKNMYYLMSQCADNFKNHIEEAVNKNTRTEIRKLSGRYTMEVICSCAFGIDVSGVDKENNPFVDIGDSVFTPSLKEFILRSLEGLFPGVLNLLNISIADPKVVAFFNQFVKQIIAEREGKPKVRRDFMDLLLEMREEGNIKGGKFKTENELQLDVTDDVIVAQAFVFFAGGYETTSSTMGFMLYELANNPDIQEKLREEINVIAAKHGGITYEALQEMQYLEMTLTEAMRKWPAGYVTLRQCVRDYRFPDVDITIGKGTLVVVPSMAMQRDPEYYPEPEKFDPERFSPENIRARKQPPPFYPFGDGPRNCIGLRFGKVSTMLGVATLLQRWRVQPATDAPPLRFSPTSITLQCLDGMFVKISNL